MSNDYKITSYDLTDCELNKSDDNLAPRQFVCEGGMNADGSFKGHWKDCSLTTFELPWTGDAKCLVTTNRHDGCTMYTVEACSVLVMAVEQVAKTEGGEWEVSDIQRQVKYNHPTHPSYEIERLWLFMRQKK